MTHFTFSQTLLTTDSPLLTFSTLCASRYYIKCKKLKFLELVGGNRNQGSWTGNSAASQLLTVLIALCKGSLSSLMASRPVFRIPNGIVSFLYRTGAMCVPLSNGIGVKRLQQGLRRNIVSGAREEVLHIAARSALGHWGWARSLGGCRKHYWARNFSSKAATSARFLKKILALIVFADL